MSTDVFRGCYHETMSASKPRLRDWLLDRMRERDWRQADLARAVQVDASQVSRWINEQDVPSPMSCRRIATALDSDPVYILALAGYQPFPESPIDLSDPLLSFFTSHANELAPEEKRAIIEIAKTMIRK